MERIGTATVSNRLSVRKKPHAVFEAKLISVQNDTLPTRILIRL
jgi:hypothetical protein